MPNLISQEQYNETINIIKGKERLNPVFNKLKAWYKEKAGFEIYNFVIEKNKYGAVSELNKYRLMYLSNGLLIVKNDKFQTATIFEADGNRSDMLRELSTNAFEYFTMLCKEHNMYENVNWQNDTVAGYDFNPIWWCETISRFAKKAIPTIRKKYGDAHIHSIINSGFGRITIFFETDKHMQMNNDNGICDEIEKFVYDMLRNKKIDKRLAPKLKKGIVDFSSKETLERDYKGNLFFYYK